MKLIVECRIVYAFTGASRLTAVRNPTLGGLGERVDG